MFRIMIGLIVMFIIFLFMFLISEFKQLLGIIIILGIAYFIGSLFDSYIKKVYFNIKKESTKDKNKKKKI
jgi:CDP-diglyceride synthetase